MGGVLVILRRLWPLWLAIVTAGMFWGAVVATDSGSKPVNACTFLPEEEVARALHVPRVHARRSPITQPANLCDYSVPGGNYGTEMLPEQVLKLVLDDSAYPHGEIGPAEQQLEVDGVELARLSDQRLLLAEGDRYVDLSLAPGVPQSERPRILVELGRPLISRWLRK